MNHNHCNCIHELKYCQCCDTVYCQKCNKEWKQQNYFPNWTLTTSDWTGTYKEYNTNHTHASH